MGSDSVSVHTCVPVAEGFLQQALGNACYAQSPSIDGTIAGHQAKPRDDWLLILLPAPGVVQVTASLLALLLGICL